MAGWVAPLGLVGAVLFCAADYYLSYVYVMTGKGHRSGRKGCHGQGEASGKPGDGARGSVTEIKAKLSDRARQAIVRVSAA